MVNIQHLHRATNGRNQGETSVGFIPKCLPKPLDESYKCMLGYLLNQ